MINKFLFKKYFNDEIKFFIINENLIIFGKFGKVVLYLNNIVFIKTKTIFEIIFLFVNKDIYRTFVHLVKFVCEDINKLYFFKLRLKGLGYRMRRLFHPMLYKFFFARNHFFYFHSSVELYIQIRKRNFFVLSYKKSKLNDIFHHFMLLKKLDFYEKTKSFITKDKILFLKKRK